MLHMQRIAIRCSSLQVAGFVAHPDTLASARESPNCQKGNDGLSVYNQSYRYDGIGILKLRLGPIGTCRENWRRGRAEKFVSKCYVFRLKTSHSMACKKPAVEVMYHLQRSAFGSKLTTLGGRKGTPDSFLAVGSCL